MTVPPPGSPPAAPSVTYLPGDWLAVVADGIAVLVDLPADSPAVTSCWNAALRGGGADGVLDAIAQAGAVPGFALAARTADGAVRVVVGGSGRAETGAPEEPTVLVADAAASRRDEQLPGGVGVRLGGSAEPDPDATPLPLTGGIAQACAIGVGVPATAKQRAGAPGAPQAAPLDSGPMPVHVPRVSADTMPPQSDFDSGLIDSLPWRTPDHFADDAEAREQREAQPPLPAAPLPAAAPELPAPFWREPPPADPYAHNPWESAAPQAPLAPQAPSAPPPWPAPNAAGPASPWAPPSAADRQPATPTEDEQASGGAAEPVSGPMVHAFACPRGHLNPPYAGNCRICDEPIPPQEGFAAPRPSLGVLRLSTGDTVPLDRDVVLGRAPFHADENAASRPHLVQLASPGNDISRSHLRVNLENWFVQVTDLGSTNGTVVTLPDQAPVRLRPHDPFTILPGTTVTIADEVTLRFEVS
ncbi:FHA domain-containing protein [Jatrophihabitans endophyticus]|uniref:FHA domain-containing protein n=1 Tax=Jatrophihabitans endophyticus TaxID=1206085 RepID=A0A1M5PBX8_9ACTN|nr:FHA domain-containing protein [Jatrophihabitans endophyticus]SHG99341.1 FHA domain-containing protein [Jatrophihabitans endophyticus]